MQNAHAQNQPAERECSFFRQYVIIVAQESNPNIKYNNWKSGKLSCCGNSTIKRLFPVFDVAGQHDRRKRVKLDYLTVLRSCQFQYLTVCRFCPEQIIDEIRLWWHRKCKMPMHKTSLPKGNGFSSGNMSSLLHRRAAPR